MSEKPPSPLEKKIKEAAPVLIRWYEMAKDKSREAFQKRAKGYYDKHHIKRLEPSFPKFLSKVVKEMHKINKDIKEQELLLEEEEEIKRGLDLERLEEEDQKRVKEQEAQKKLSEGKRLKEL